MHRRRERTEDRSRGPIAAHFVINLLSLRHIGTTAYPDDDPAPSPPEDPSSDSPIGEPSHSPLSE